MCGTAKSSSTTTIPPELLNAYRGVTSAAQNFYGSTTPQNYSNNPSDFVAPLNQTQQAGVSNVNSASGQAQPYYQAATQTLGGANGSSMPYYRTATQATNAGVGLGAAGNAQAWNTMSSAAGTAAPYQQAGLGTMGDAYNQAQPYTQEAATGVRTAQGQGTQYNNTALGTMNKAYAGANPYNMAATGLAAAGTGAVHAGQIGGNEINQFMSPYIGSVLQGTQNMLNQQNQMAMSGQTGNAIKAGAFGGDRAGIAAANLAQQQRLADSSIYSNILNQGYGQALGAAQQQQGVNLGAEQANRAALQQGAGQMLNIGQQGFQQGATTAAQQAGIGQQQFSQGLSAAQQQAALGQQQYTQGMSLGQAQMNYGNQLFNQNATIAQQQGALANQMYSQGLGASQSYQDIGKNIYGQGAQTSQQLAALGQGAQGSSLQGAQAQLAAGQIQQQTDQAQKQAMYNQWYQTQYGLPMQLLNTYAGAVEGVGQNMGSSTETRKPAGLFDFLSDKRAKENIEAVGKTNDGQTIYRYNYKGDPRTQIGLIAQEVEHKHPGAVTTHDGGLKGVDYEKATDSSVRSKKYAGGLAEGYADGGMPTFDVPTFNELAASQAGMYKDGFAGAGPEAAPNFSSQKFSAPTPGPAMAGSAPSHDTGLNQPEPPNIVEDAAKKYVVDSAKKEVNTLWDEHAKKPVSDAIEAAKKAIPPKAPAPPPPTPNLPAGAPTPITPSIGTDAATAALASAPESIAAAGAPTAAATAAVAAAPTAEAATAAAAAAPDVAAAIPEIAAIAAAFLSTGGSARRKRASGGLLSDPETDTDTDTSGAGLGADLGHFFPGFKRDVGSPPTQPVMPLGGTGLSPVHNEAATSSGNILDKVMPLIEKAEGSGKNKLSSATGPFQIINDNFVKLFKQLYPDRAAGMSKSDIIGLRSTSEGISLSREMAPELAKENVSALKSNGLPVTPGNIYLTWFLGPRYGVKTLQSHPTTPVDKILPDSFISANPSVLKGKTAAEVANWAADRLESVRTKMGRAAPQGFARGGYALDGSVEDDTLAAPDKTGLAAAPAPDAEAAPAPTGLAPPKDEPKHDDSMIGSIERFGSSLWKGAKKGMEGYRKGLEEGNAEQWIPLLSGVVGAVTAPTNGIGNALAYGLGTGIKTYQGQRNYGLEERKVGVSETEARAKVLANSLAYVNSTFRALNDGTIYDSKQYKKLTPEQYVEYLRHIPGVSDYLLTPGGKELLALKNSSAPLPPEEGGSAGTPPRAITRAITPPMGAPAKEAPPSDPEGAAPSARPQSESATDKANAPPAAENAVQPPKIANFGQAIRSQILVQPEFSAEKQRIDELRAKGQGMVDDAMKPWLQGSAQGNNFMSAGTELLAQAQAAQNSLMERVNSYAGAQEAVTGTAIKEVFGRQNAAQQTAYESALNAATALRNIQVAEGSLKDPETGKYNLNSGPIGPALSRIGGIMQQLGFSEKAIKSLIGTDPNASGVLDKMAFNLASESVRSELPGQQIRVSEFNQALASMAKEDKPAYVIDFLLNNVLKPKALLAMQQYEKVKDLNPLTDNIQGAVYEFEKGHKTLEESPKTILDIERGRKNQTAAPATAAPAAAQNPGRRKPTPEEALAAYKRME